MNRMIVRASAVLALSMMVLPALAGPPKDDKKPAGEKCPACPMTMTSKKTDKQNTAYVNKKTGKTVYCCDHCKMDEKLYSKKVKSPTKM